MVFKASKPIAQAMTGTLVILPQIAAKRHYQARNSAYQ
jgi:hypothetical protein